MGPEVFALAFAFGLLLGLFLARGSEKAAPENLLYFPGRSKYGLWDGGVVPVTHWFLPDFLKGRMRARSAEGG